MPIRPFIIVAWLGLLIASAYLRFHDLEVRPMHADEATGARILAQRLESDDYSFNPKHFHGPALSLSTQLIAVVRGESTWNELSKRTVRMGPALAGLLMVLTPLLWLRQIGATAALLAGAFIATSPLIVYYNRMFIHESLLALLGMIAVALIYKLIQRPSRWLAVTSGIAIGLMFATKETFAISMIAWSVAASACLLYRPLMQGDMNRIQPRFKDYIKAAGLIAIAAAFTATLFYTNGFQNLNGIGNAIKTFFVYETTEGHSKAFSYYFQLLLWPKHTLGSWWSEALIGLLAVISILKLLRHSRINETILFLAVASGLHLFIYSCIGYKTPWLMLLPWAQVCLLAGVAIHSLQKSSRAIRLTCALLIVAGLGYQTKQSLHANGPYASDARNPYAYVPTSKDVEVLEQWLDQLIQQKNGISESTIAVIGSEYWPLPWYLRAFDSIGYWPEPETRHADYPLVFVMPEQVLSAGAKLQDSHTELPRSLRAEVPVVLYLRNDIWQQWTEASAP